MIPENLLITIGRLLLPERRAEAIQELKDAGVLTTETERILADLLAGGWYTNRTLFAKLAPVKIELDAWIRNHRFNQFRPTYALDAIEMYARGQPDILTHGWLAGKDVMDFGAGRFSPASLAIVLYANGARTVTAFEPAGWSIDHATTAMRELVAGIMMSPQTYCLPGCPSSEEIRRRLCDIRFNISSDDVVDLGPIRLIRRFDFAHHESAFDLVLSRSVLEHVKSFDTEIANHLTILKPGGVSINRVDFTDHRHWEPQNSPFGFYADGVTCGCNLLRVSDLDRAARASGALYEIKDANLVAEAVVRRKPLLERFAAYEMDSLRTSAATLVLKAERMPPEPFRAVRTP